MVHALGAAKSSMLGLVAMLLVAVTSAAQEFGDFTLTTDGGDGSVSEGTPASSFTLRFTITGNHDETANRFTRFQAEETADTEVVYIWNYSTEDDGPSFDLAGMTVDGSDTQLTNNSGPSTRSGTGSLELDADTSSVTARLKPPA